MEAQPDFWGWSVTIYPVFQPRVRMDLDQQIQALIENAPQDGQTPKIVAAIAPALKALAMQLRHSEYYILQTLDRRWLVTTLSNRAQPSMEKQVIYGFPTLKDATNAAYAPRDERAIALPVPTIHILFQLTAIDKVDSLVFFENPNELVSGTEVRREDIQNLIRAQLKQYQDSLPRSRPGNIPPNLA